MDQEKISAVLITKNEQKVLARCIKSLVGVDEVVVLDTGSTDRTISISKELGAQVREADPIVPFHFGLARNVAQLFAHNDWIISIDADEVLRPGMLRRIRNAMEDNKDATAFDITFTDRGMAITKKKIFRKSSWQWKYRVHEQLMGDGPVKNLESVVFEHLPEPDKTRRHGQNIELLKITIQENPEYTRAFKHLGQELMLDKAYVDAIPYLTHFVENTDEGPLEKSEVMMRLGQCYGEMRDLEKASKWFDMSSQTDPRRREPLYHGGWFLIKNAHTVGDLVQAADFLKRCIAIPLGKKPHSNLDQPAVWGLEPNKMLSYCQEQIAKYGYR